MLEEQVQLFIENALKLDRAPELEVPTQEQFGHYATNVALQRAKVEKRAPLELAREYKTKLEAADTEGWFSKIEIAGPGFINFYLTKEFLHAQLVQLVKEKNLFATAQIGEKQRVIIEFSSPNIAKPMHVGHLRSTIIGTALANIYAALGYRVIRWNYIGDWGTQFGKLIAAYKRWGDPGIVAQDPINELNKLYVQFHAELKAQPELERLGQEEFKKLETGDKENRKLWEWFRAESLKEFAKIYDQLGVTLDVTSGESAQEKNLKKVLKELKKSGLAQESEGAWIVSLEKEHLPPAILQKSDGASVYFTREIAALKSRIKKYKPAKMLYVVGNEQTLHFEQLFAVAKRIGIEDTELVHIKYGLVLGPTGKKLSTREGGTVRLKEALDKAIDLAKSVGEQKNARLSPEEKNTVAKAVGIGALKYNDLKENRQSDIQFNWAQMLNLQGDTAPYLQYTYARLKSILRKGEEAGLTPDRKGIALVKEEIELRLMKKLADFTSIVVQCAKSNLTSYLATYLYDLAKLVNQYYEIIPILKDENEARKNARLLLITQAGRTLQAGLNLLGIETLEQI